jgi:phosphoserine phosphatase RsbX
VVEESRDIEWGSTSRFRAGETTGGDLGMVVTVPRGTLVAVIDGAGHGPDAARAAAAAADVVRGFAGDDLRLLVRDCDEALRPTRGAAVSIALLSIADRQLTWAGVGNVEGRLVRSQTKQQRRNVSLPLVSGVLGRGLPRVRPTTVDLELGDVLILATDGVSASFADWLHPTGRPEEIAEGIVEDHGKAADDRLVLVVRYLGRPA